MTAAIAAVAAAAGTERPRAAPDISSWLQRRLDRAGGIIFLPRLGDGRCYQSRGLWVSRSDTTITSDGACLIVLGAGPVRLRSADGDPIAASAAFFISRSAATAPPPEEITISGLRIRVPPGAIDGIDVYARHVRISDVSVDGSPFDNVYIGGRTNLIAYSSDVRLSGSTLLGAERNVISVTAAVTVRIERNTIAGAGGEVGPAADPGDGIDVEPNAPGDPILGVRIARNLIVGNAHEGIALRFHPGGRLSAHADGIRINGNALLDNYPFGGGAQIAISGGQSDRRGRIVIAQNRFGRGGGTSLDRARSCARLTVADNLGFRSH